MKYQKEKAVIVGEEIKINEARDHLFFTIMSRSGAIIFELTHYCFSVTQQNFYRTRNAHRKAFHGMTHQTFGPKNTGYLKTGIKSPTYLI